MAWITSENLAEELWNEGNIQKRFKASQEELRSVIDGATDRQQGYLYHLWQKSRNFEIYKVLKNLGLEPLSK